MTPSDNLLFYGDNLDVLHRHIADESVDLVYLDPPFKSEQNYNVLFREQDGTRAHAQIEAFEDTWQWDEAAAAAFHETVEGGGKMSEVLQAFRLFPPTLAGTRIPFRQSKLCNQLVTDDRIVVARCGKINRV